MINKKIDSVTQSTFLIFKRITHNLCLNQTKQSAHKIS
jgi:hypothetical protein